MAIATVSGPPGAAACGGDAGGDRPVLLARARLVAQVLGRIYRSFLLTLLVAALLPTLWGWSSFVVRSGSMEPSISVGDVVVAKPFASGSKVPVGRVVIFPNPAKPDSGELLVHRVVENLGGGKYATAGDANPSNDPTPITDEGVDSRATLLVPFVGRPFVWLANGNMAPLVLWSGITVLAFALATQRFGRRRNGDGPGAGRPAPGRRHRGFARRHPAAAVPVLALLVAGGIGLAGSQSAMAGFTARTISPSNTWAASASLGHRVTLATPGAVVRGAVPLTATMSNTSVGDGYTVRMEYARAGTSTWTTACTKSASPYSCAWATDGLTNDRYDLRAVATSSSRTLTSPVVTGVLVDNLAPSVTMQNPGTPLRGRVTFAATAADAHSGVASVVLQYALAGSTTWRDLASDTSSPYSYEFDTTTLVNGTYSFRAIAADVAGNATISVAVTNRVVDNVVTSVVLNDPGPVISGTVTLTASAASTAGVASVRIQGAPAGTASWGDVCTDTTSPYTCVYNTTFVADGLYDLRAIVTDGAGRTTTSTVVANRRVDNTAPRASDVQTTNGAVAGKLDTADTMAFTYTEQMRPTSISPGWDGSSVAVSLRLRDGNSLGLGSTGDTVDILRGGSAVNLGSVNLREDYISTFGTAQFNATMTASTVTVNGVTMTRVTITVASQASGTTTRTVTNSSTMSWTPSGVATDLGGLGTNTTTALESGTFDRQF
ncbi:signal peptidase I [Nocardioides conyzicola]|uniref:Signal peptidase I n=1 Tax=Nocardioides conyzicola TaxID=1651781 RepID=A0ABP8Y3R9_9ACTN